MSEQLQTEINDLIIQRLGQLQTEVEILRGQVETIKANLRAAAIHPEMFTLSEAPDVSA